MREPHAGRDDEVDAHRSLAGLGVDRLLEQPPSAPLEDGGSAQRPVRAYDLPHCSLVRECRLVLGILAPPAEKLSLRRVCEQVAPEVLAPAPLHLGPAGLERRREALRRLSGQERSRTCGKSRTSRMFSRPLSTIASRSMPRPSPPVGGIP